MKKQYISPELEILYLSETTITTSSNETRILGIDPDDERLNIDSREYDADYARGLKS